MKTYWLTLYPGTFSWLKDGKALIYNTDAQEPTVVDCSSEIENLYKELLLPDNLYTIELVQNQLSESMVTKFIEQIQEAGAGMLVENNGINRKPVSFTPIFKLQRGVEHLKWEHDRGIGGTIINNLHEITLYINGSKNGNNYFYKQIPYPVNVNEVLDIDSVTTFISACKGGSLRKINIVGNLFRYPNFDVLLDWLLSLKVEIQLYIPLEDLDVKSSSFEKWSAKDISINIVIYDLSSLSRLADVKEEIFFKVNPVFIATSESEVEEASDFMAKHKSEDYNVVALFTGDNFDFFERFIFMTIDDIENIKLSKREVFVNMALNIHSFGKLTVMPNRKVYANVNEESLGYIDTPIYDMIFKEMTEGHSWLHIRDVEPCCNCVYQWLCPSPSNYELVIEKPNLCHVFG